MKLIKSIVPFFVILVLTLGLGYIGSLLGGDAAAYYSQNIVRPAFSPPAIAFPIVWTILYILMAVSAYIIYRSDSTDKSKALAIYAVQLIVNVLWTPIFFGLKRYFGAFLWIILLIIWVIIMIKEFKKINKVAAYLQVPYLLWLIFASLLNFAVFMLNK